MLIPSIDLMGGRVVQLVQGEDLALGFDDLEYWIERFAGYPLVQLIDLDAAKRQGDNRRLIESIVRRLPCQVGGGIRSSAEAQILLSMGAQRVIFGSSLFDGRAVSEPTDGGSSATIANLVRTQFAEELAFSLGVEQLVFSVDTKDSKVARLAGIDRITPPGCHAASGTVLRYIPLYACEHGRHSVGISDRSGAQSSQADQAAVDCGGRHPLAKRDRRPGCRAHRRRCRNGNLHGLDEGMRVGSTTLGPWPLVVLTDPNPRSQNRDLGHPYPE
jgi:imidazole glycerol phosphate synthase subunit HisF